MNMPVTTTFTIEGHRITQYKGIARGIIVRSPTMRSRATRLAARAEVGAADLRPVRSFNSGFETADGPFGRSSIA
jgi:hypothetical protein